MSDRFKLHPTGLNGLYVAERQPVADERGMLERIFCAEELQAFFRDKNIVQINRTLTARRGSVRGLHFQYPPHTEAKSVSCLHGEIYDVAVDLRRDSPTFLEHHAEILSGDNHRSLLIPAGFAHGFQALSDDAELLYLHTAAWHRDAEGGLNVNDTRLGIPWPLPVSELSKRDAAHPLLDDDFTGVVL